MLEDGQVIVTEEGTPQGAVISPLLANIYLHYVYDLWVQHWRQRSAKGDVIVVRYADDTIVGFEHWHEAEQFLADLKMRLARFGLTLHPDKTRLLEFGRFAIANGRARGLGNPEAFDFLGFTHYCANRRDGGGFVLGRKPVRTRMRAKLREIKEHLQAMQHDGIERQGRWLAQVLRGWLAYYAVPMSGSAITAFRHHMIERWLRVLQRRSQRTRRSLSWGRMKRIADHTCPARTSYIRGPNNGSSSPSKARALAALAGICAGGGRAISVPTATRAPAPRRDPKLRGRIALGKVHQHADPPHALAPSRITLRERCCA